MITLNKTMYLTRFNSWDANVILCLSTILPEALVITMMKTIKSVHEKYCLEQAVKFYCDRGTPTGIDMIYFSRGSYTPLCNLLNIPTQFHININELNSELIYRWYLSEPEDRYDFFEWAYETGEYYMWTAYTLTWTKGFHSGRYFLMDLRRRLTADDIRDYPKEEHEFIVKQNHIDDLFS